MLEEAEQDRGLLRQHLGQLRVLLAGQSAAEPLSRSFGELQERRCFCSILDITRRRCAGGRAEGRRSNPPCAPLASAVLRIALHCLRAERVPCDLLGFLQESYAAPFLPHPPPPITFRFLNTGVEQPLFTCLGLS